MALDANEDVDFGEFEDYQGYESDGSDEDGDQAVATLNSVLQKLGIQGKKWKDALKKALRDNENLNMRMTRGRIYEIVDQLEPSTGHVKIDNAFNAVVTKEAQAVAKQPRDLAGEYLRAMANPPVPSSALVGQEKANYLLFLQSRDQVRALLGIDNANEKTWVVAWVDAGDNAKKLAAYLGIACYSIEAKEVNAFDGVILYGHTAYAPWPNGQSGTDRNDPRMGQGKLYTPAEVWSLVGDPTKLAVIGCNSQAFTAKLSPKFPKVARIIFTDQPFHWHKAGNQCPEFILAQNTETKQIFGTLINILQ